jgi:hypothetical protein
MTAARGYVLRHPETRQTLPAAALAGVSASAGTAVARQAEACGGRWETYGMDRAYYSQRIGRGPLGDPTIEDVARALRLTVAEMQRRDYLQEWHGYYCQYSGDVDGRAGSVSLTDHIEAETGWRSAWPLPDPVLNLDSSYVAENYEQLRQEEEDKLFDLIEYFHRHVSEGIEDAEESAFHVFEDSPCGWHYRAFDPGPAQVLFRGRMDRVLSHYRGGFRISENGRVERTADEGFEQLLDAALPKTEAIIAQRVTSAVALYRNRGRTDEDLRRAVRELFDVLEKLRPQMKAEMLQKDESALFNIANNFTIRHLRESEKGHYDSPLWHSWMFYVNLATIHVMTRVIARKAAQAKASGQPATR